jgi:outer membrane protein assembly factor BamE (lipoprotein component of BamABCDE complex)
MLGVLVVLAGCAAQTTTGAFTQVTRIEKELVRGTSTKADVRRLLGTPKGVGSTQLPGDPRLRETWFYEDVASTSTRAAGRGEILADVRQQILIVTFDKGVFDGFLWYSTETQAEAR